MCGHIMIKSGHSYMSTDFLRGPRLLLFQRREEKKLYRTQEYGKRVQNIFCVGHMLTVRRFFMVIKWTIHCCINSMGNIISSIERIHARKFNGQNCTQKEKAKEKTRSIWTSKERKNEILRTKVLPVEMIYSCWKW